MTLLSSGVSYPWGRLGSKQVEQHEPRQPVLCQVGSSHVTEYGEIIFSLQTIFSFFPSEVSKLLVTCTAICLFGLSCYGITKLEQRFEERWLIPDDSYLAKWFDDQREFFKQGGERGTIYFADFNLTNNQLERITQLVKNLKNETEIISEVDQWAVEFSERFHNGSLKEDPEVHLAGMVQGHLNNDPMIKKLGQFLKSKEGLHYRDRFVFANNAKPSCVEVDLPALVMFKIQFQHPLFSGMFISP